jgi:hypothetical protein
MRRRSVMADEGGKTSTDGFAPTWMNQRLAIEFLAAIVATLAVAPGPAWRLGIG